jgi:uncharacterized protein
MRIGIDIDGVISNFVGAFIPLAERQYGISLRDKDIYVHDLYLVLGVREEEAMGLIRQAIESDPQPYEGAIETLRELCERHHVILMTARPKDLMSVTTDWLTRWKVSFHDLIHLDEGLKHEADLGLDLIVDDHLREAFGFIDKVPHIVIFDRPWNHTLNLGRLFERVTDWNELLLLIRRLSSA